MLSDTWQVVRHCSVYDGLHDGAHVIGNKADTVMVRGWQVGDWVHLVDEPGFIHMYAEADTAAVVGSRASFASKRRSCLEPPPTSGPTQPPPAVPPATGSGGRKPNLEVWISSLTS